jgi:hypothetical protein
VHGLSRLLQLEDGGVLILAGIQQLLERHDLLDQLPGKPRDLCLSELEQGSHLPQRGAFPPKLALCLFPSRALVLESRLSLLEGGSLLLELALRLLTRAPLLAKLLLQRSE